MKIKIQIQKPVILNAKFRDKIRDIPSFEEQLREDECELEQDALEGAAILGIIGILMLAIAIIIFHPSTQKRVQEARTTIIYRCK